MRIVQIEPTAQKSHTNSFNYMVYDISIVQHITTPLPAAVSVASPCHPLAKYRVTTSQCSRIWVKTRRSGTERTHSNPPISLKNPAGSQKMRFVIPKHPRDGAERTHRPIIGCFTSRHGHSTCFHSGLRDLPSGSEGDLS
jgi:hypothetical protein